MEFDLEILKWAYREGMSLVVVILLIYYIRDRDKAFKTLINENTEAFKNNSLITGQVSEALRQHSSALQTLLYGIRHKEIRIISSSDSEEDS